VDEIDRRIIQALRGEGRISNAELAAAVGLSASACHRRVLLEESGIIRGYTALIGGGVDEPGLVFLTQFILDRQTKDYLNRFEAAVRRCPEVQDCYLMTGTADYEWLHKEVLSRLPGGCPAAIELRDPNHRGGGPAALSVGVNTDLRGAPQ
jgi:DNA-binding Lrp family transcriptional regulator